MTLNANQTELTLNSTTYDLLDVLEYANSTLDPTSYPVSYYCTYPISGQYGMLPRILFYCLLIVALLTRGKQWIAGACLGGALTYSGSAAVHAFLLMLRFKFGRLPEPLPETYEEAVHPASSLGDIDMDAIWMVLRSAGIMLTPLLNWSSTVRRLQARPILVWWGLLVFVGCICAMTASIRRYDVPYRLAVTTCYTRTGSPRCGHDLSLRDDFFLDTTYWEACKCEDTCGSGLNATDAKSPYRTGSSMVPWLWAPESKRRKPVHDFEHINHWAVLPILILMTITLVQVQRSPGQTRNSIFRMMHAKAAPSGASSVRRRLGLHAARLAAASYYLAVALISAICPLFFIGTMISGELELSTYPVNEPPRTVGQWAPWTQAGLVVAGSLIQRYNAKLGKFVRLCANRVLRLNSNSAFIPAPRSGARLITFKDAGRYFVKQLRLPFRLVARETLALGRHLGDEAKGFVAWCRDPVARSALIDDADDDYDPEAVVMISRPPSSGLDDTAYSRIEKGVDTRDAGQVEPARPTPQGSPRPAATFPLSHQEHGGHDAPRPEERGLELV